MEGKDNIKKIAIVGMGAGGKISEAMRQLLKENPDVELINPTEAKEMGGIGMPPKTPKLDDMEKLLLPKPSYHEFPEKSGKEKRREKRKNKRKKK